MFLIKTLQGVEQSTANIMYFSLAEKLYPNTGYHSETGGYLQNLRNSTNIEKVRDYHREYYRWGQLIIFITQTCLCPPPSLNPPRKDCKRSRCHNNIQPGARVPNVIVYLYCGCSLVFMFMAVICFLELKTWFLPSLGEWTRRSCSIRSEKQRKKSSEKDLSKAVRNSSDPGPLR